MKIEAAIFDLDGVISKTALQHAKAWKILFDRFLKEYSVKYNLDFIEFDINQDYLMYVDGKPRIEGIKSFLSSREIHLEDGNEDSDKSHITVWGLGKIKDNIFRKSIVSEGVSLYESTIDLVNILSDSELPIAVASSSKNCRRVLSAAELSQKFDVVFDGTDLDKEGLPGKPAPDLFLRAAEILNVNPKETVIFEDSVAGIESGKSGKFGYLVGIDRGGNDKPLLNAGSDVVVKDLSELTFDTITKSLCLR